MPNEWVPVVDTAIKIGLGGLIAGLTTYFISSNNNAHDLKRNFTQKKMDLLEHTMNDACSLITECENYISYLRGSEKKNDAFGEKVSDKLYEELLENDVKLNEQLDLYNPVASKLRFLNIEDSRDAFANIHNKAIGIRNDFFFSRVLPTDKELKAGHETIQIESRKFFDGLNNYMTNI